MRLRKGIKISSLVLMLGGCFSDRIAHLEKNVEELQESVKLSERRQGYLSSQIEELQKENEALRTQFEQQPPPSASSFSNEAVPSEAPSASQPILLSDIESPSIRSADVSLLSSPDDLYSKAFENFQKSQYHQAILQFSVFTERYSQHELTGSAFYWIGESWYGLRNYTKALASFERVLERFPKGNKASDSLFKKALCLQKLGSIPEALQVLEELVRRFPAGPNASKAKNKIKEMQQSGDSG